MIQGQSMLLPVALSEDLPGNSAHSHLIRSGLEVYEPVCWAVHKRLLSPTLLASPAVRPALEYGARDA